MGVRQGRVREVALTVGAALGVCCLLAAVLSVGFGIHPLVFRSGSMGPGIPTGALGLARTVPAGALHRGDVVSVSTADGTRVTHRIVAILSDGTGAVGLTLRGDANPVADADPYVVRQADRLFWSAPRLGYVVSALSSRPAAFAGGLLCGVLAMVVVGRRESGPVGSDPGDPAAAPDRPRGLSPGRVGLGVVVAVALLAPGHPTPAYAAWSDTGTASGTFTTLTVPSTALTCTAAVTSVTFRWTAVAGASYVLTVQRTNGTVYSTTPVAAGSTSYTAGGLLASGTATIVAVRYTGLWTSAASNSVSFTLGLFCG
jgi:signal peptidase I